MSVLAIEGNSSAQVTAAQVTVRDNRPAEVTDAAALQICVQDAASAEMWLAQEQWKLQWREADILYQSPRTVQMFENSSTPRASVSRFTVAKHTNSLVPMMMSGIFYEKPPFILRPRQGTTEATCRAKTALHSFILDDIGFKPECEIGMESQVLNGTGIWQKGWEVREEIKKTFVRKRLPGKIALPLTGDESVDTEESDEFEVKEEKVIISRPFLEYCPLGTVLPDPKWNRANDIRKAKFVIKRRYLSFNKLNELRTKPGYHLPSEEDLKKLFFGAPEIAAPDTSIMEQQHDTAAIHHAERRDARTTADPLEYDLKVDERWDKDRVMVVVQDKLMIRNEEHLIGDNSFLSANFWNIQNAGYGLGIGRLIGSDQRIDVGVTNSALDMLSYGVNAPWVVSRGANAFAQQLRARLGGFIQVDGDVNKAMKPMEMPKLPPELWAILESSKQSSTSTSGADEAMVQGNLPGKGGSSIGRTATGAGGIIAANASKIQGPVGRFVENVFIPFIVWMDKAINDRMPIKEIRQIIGDRLGNDFKFDIENFLNASLEFEVLAGAHLAAKKAMAMSLPFIIQIFENPHMLESLNSTGWTIDIKELLNMLMEMSEWKNDRDIIRPFTKQESEAYQQSKIAAAQATAQAGVQKEQAKHAATQEQIDQKNEAQLASKLTMDSVDRGHAEVERSIVKKAEAPGAGV